MYLDRKWKSSTHLIREYLRERWAIAGKAVREKRDGPSALPTSAKFGQIWGTRRVIGRLTEEPLAKRRTARCAALGIDSCMAGLLLENRKSLPGWAGSFPFASIPKNFLL
jgi:hypothetical protein